MNDDLIGQELPPGIDPVAIGHAQIDDVTLAVEESDFNRRSKAIVREEQRLAVLQRKRCGASFRQISRELGISQSKVQALFAEGMKDSDGLTLAQSRKLMLERLEHTGMLLYGRMVGNGFELDLDAHRAWLQTMTTIIKLVGLDQHQQGDDVDDVSDMDADTVDERLAAMFIRNGMPVPASLRQSLSFARTVTASRKAVDGDAW